MKIQNFIFPKKEIDVGIPLFLVNSNINIEFDTTIENRRYTITKMNNTLLIKYRISSCVDAFCLSFIKAIKSTINLEKENAVCTFEISAYFKTMTLFCLFLTIAIPLLSLLSTDASFDILSLTPAFLIVLMFYLIFKYALSYVVNIIKDDLTEIVKECATKIRDI